MTELHQVFFFFLKLFWLRHGENINNIEENIGVLELTLVGNESTLLCSTHEKEDRKVGLLDSVCDVGFVFGVMPYLV